MNLIEIPFDTLKGRTFSEVFRVEETIVLRELNGAEYRLMHEQNCCEWVTLESIVGDLNYLTFSPILLAESSDGYIQAEDSINGVAWTFYKLATINGYVDIRWIGDTDNRYSEEVYLYRVETF